MKLFFKGAPLQPADTRALAIAATGGNGDNNQNGGPGKYLLIALILLAVVALSGGIWWMNQPTTPPAATTITLRELYRSHPLMDIHGNPIPWATIEGQLRQGDLPSCRTTPTQEEILRRINTEKVESDAAGELGRLTDEFNKLMLELARVDSGPHDCCDIARLLKKLHDVIVRIFRISSIGGTVAHTGYCITAISFLGVCPPEKIRECPDGKGLCLCGF